MEAITVSAGKGVSRWTQALLGGAGSSREAGTQTCQQLTHLRKGLRVYPGEDGEPEDSLRLEVFHEALQDQRALQLLEKFIPRRRIIKLLDRLSPGGQMSMANYPRGEKNILALRQKINALLKKHTAC